MWLLASRIVQILEMKCYHNKNLTMWEWIWNWVLGRSRKESRSVSERLKNIEEHISRSLMSFEEAADKEK